MFIPMWDLLEASRETLEVLNLPVKMHDPKQYLRLWRMRFPRLRSLGLGIWHCDVQGAPDKFTEFIVAHGDTLEELDLAYGRFDRQVMAFDGSKMLKRDSLPKLKKFRGHTSAFIQMVDTQMDCLGTTLERVEVGTGVTEYPDSDFYNLFLTECLGLRPSEPKMPLSALRELKLDMSQMDIYPFQSFTNIVALAHPSCPSLEVWLGDITKKIGVKSLVEVFSLFKKLRVIYLRRVVIGTSNIEKVKKYVVELAAGCAKLEKVVITHLAFPKKDISLLIARDDPGSVPRVYCVEELDICSSLIIDR
jgi:hypothetical protein